MRTSVHPTQSERMLVPSLSVVLSPMMLDRGTDVVTAVQTSLRAVMTNPLPMLA